MLICLGNAYGGSQPVAGTARPLGTPASSAKSTSAKGLLFCCCCLHLFTIMFR